MANARLYRVLETRLLEEKLDREGLPSEERQLIEAELRRRERDTRPAPIKHRRALSRSGGPPQSRWWRHPLFGFLIVYAVPFFGMGTWTYFNWLRWEQYRDFADPGGLDATLRCLHLPATYAARGKIGAFGAVIVLLTLISIPYYCFNPRPAYGVLSFLAIVWWIIMGNVLFAAGI